MSNFNSFPQNNGGLYNFNLQALPFVDQATGGAGMEQGQQGQFDGRSVASHPVQEQVFKIYVEPNRANAYYAPQHSSMDESGGYYGEGTVMSRVHYNTPAISNKCVDDMVDDMDFIPVPLTGIPSEDRLVSLRSSSGDNLQARPQLLQPTGRTMSDIPCLDAPTENPDHAINAMNQGVGGLRISGHPR